MQLPQEQKAVEVETRKKQKEELQTPEFGIGQRRV